MFVGSLGKREKISHKLAFMTFSNEPNYNEILTTVSVLDLTYIIVKKHTKGWTTSYDKINNGSTQTDCIEPSNNLGAS